MDVRPLPLDSPILVAASSPADLSALRTILQELQLSNVTYAENLHTALHFGRFERQTLILISSSLADGGSEKFIAAIRKEGKNTQVPIVLVHDPGEEAASQRATSVGATKVLAKPLEVGFVREAMEQLLDCRILTASEKKQREEVNLSATEITVQQGKEFLSQRDYTSAKLAYEEAMITGGGSVEVFCGLAETNLNLGNFEEAEQVIREAEVIEPRAREEYLGREKVFIDKGHEELEKQEFRQAKHEFECAIAINYKSVPGYAGLSESLDGLGDNEGAQKAFEHALSIDDRPKSLHVYNRMGIVARHKKEHENALRCYEKALSFDPNDPILHYNKAMVYVAQSEYQEALELLEKALELMPEFPEARHASKGISLLMSK